MLASLRPARIEWLEWTMLKSAILRGMSTLYFMSRITADYFIVMIIMVINTPPIVSTK